jgi:nucleotide-binding universal stress UspA family protein
MFKHILVPLDGSALAESALPAAACAAGMLGSKVSLIHIIEKDAPATVHGERHLKETAEAEAYLEDAARRFFPAGQQVERHVHTAATRDVGDGIVAHQSELAPDLVVMCTHGRRGLRQMILGSIAERVIRAGRIPILLIRPDPTGPRPFVCRIFLVPVDGDPVHEQGLEIAVSLAAATGAAVRLLSVVRTPKTLSGPQAATERFMPGATRVALDLAVQNLKGYQAGQMARIRERGVAASGEVRLGDTEDVIVDAAEQCDASVIVIATHGRKGSEAFWTHSVGAEVQSKTTRPLLLVPLKRDVAAEC